MSRFTFAQPPKPTSYAGSALSIDTFDLKGKKLGTVPMTYNNENGVYFKLNKPHFKHEFNEDKFGKVKAVVTLTQPEDLKFLRALEDDVFKQLGEIANTQKVSLDCAGLVFDSLDGEPCLRVTFPMNRSELRPLEVNGQMMSGEEILNWLGMNHYAVGTMEVCIRLWYRKEDTGEIKAGFYSHLERLTN